VNTIAPTTRDTPGLTWRSLSSPAFDKWISGILGGLVVGWTYLPIALWVAFFGALVGLIAGGFGGATSGIAQTLHIGAGVGFAAAVGGLFVGAFYGLVFIYTEFFNNLLTIMGGLVSGLAVSLFTLWLMVHFEDQLLRLRGYREPSRRERQLIDPIVAEILQRMSIAGPRPIFYVSDSREPAAWTHASSIVLAQGLLGSYDDSENPPVPDMPPNAFAAVIAHEISHWARADGVGIRAVWACCWPIVAVYNLACILGRNPNRKFTTLGWILFWPAWVSIQVVTTILASAMRTSEYEADARTASLGDEYRAGLRTALGEFRDWEAPRTGWEDVLHATHPSIEHRLQRLETPPPPQLLIHADGLTDITVTDPDIINAYHLYAQALADGDAAPIVMRERDLHQICAAWLRRVKQAKERGEQTEVAASLTDLEGRIANLDYQAEVGRLSVTLTNAVLGDIVCHDPAVAVATRRYLEAQDTGDIGPCAAREHEQLTAIVAWLRTTKQAMEQGAPVDVTETIEGLDLRITDYEQKAAALLQQTGDGPTTAA
jgi:Zn-dependent protease with chaperone function